MLCPGSWAGQSRSAALDKRRCRHLPGKIAAAKIRHPVCFRWITTPIYQAEHRASHRKLAVSSACPWRQSAAGHRCDYVAIRSASTPQSAPEFGLVP